MASADDNRIHDVTTTLRSELAALQYKRDRLLNEVGSYDELRLIRVARILKQAGILFVYEFTVARRENAT